MRKIGYATFKQTFTEHVESELIDAENRLLLNRQEWDFRLIGYGQKIKTIFQHMYQTDTEEPCIETSTDSFLKVISHIKFQNMKKMFFAFCGLSNMQALAFIDAPNLKMIVLAYNRLTIFKPANKIMFPSLDDLNLLKNRITEIDIGRHKINQQQLYLGYRHVWRLKMIPIIGFYAKMQPIKQNRDFDQNLTFYLHQEKSLSSPQQRIVKSLLRKFNKNQVKN